MTHLASKIGPECRYLEIGCAHNELFDAMPITHKIGVDPAIGGTHKMTSEAFFADFPDERFDLIFIDGLHTYEQVRADLVNALRVLRPGGYIGLHDMLPKEWGEAFVPRIQGEWTGDVWKVAHEIAVTEGLDFRVFHMDAGVGLVRVPGDPNVQLADMQAELIPAQYDYFCAHLDRVKQVTWDEGMEWLSGQEG
ncbi:MAG: hypothetical protein COA47_05580 [Robiginitomaculum sp.]|nr:MAG: hypothetical protein COA47_05580 [Robiginitomaculum sp.]